MNISASMSEKIVGTACDYLGKQFDYYNFNCVHFVRIVYKSIGIDLPLLDGKKEPPKTFHLSSHEYDQMPIGHSVFLRRKATVSTRVWTHVAIIISKTDLIHCTRHCGNGVIITSKSDLMNVYDLVTINTAI